MSSQDAVHEFESERSGNIARLGADADLKALSLRWNIETARYKYTYNFTCLGRPIIQFPQDMVALQEIIWRVKPDLIIETGIAHGGSLMLSASMLAMLDYCDAVESGGTLDTRSPKRRVLGIDIDIRPHNRAAILDHPMAGRIEMIEGSSIDESVISRVCAVTKDYRTILVILDSNHTHEHVLSELEAYAPLVTPGSYCIVFDTIIEDLPDGMFPNRPWHKGNNPKTAVHEYLERLHLEGRVAKDGGNLLFKNDVTIEHKLLVTVAPNGYLQRIA